MSIAKLDTIFEAAKVFVPEVFDIERGFVKETYSTAKYQEPGLSDVFVLDSVSFSTCNVLRGLHYDFKMSKLVQVLRGRIWDVIVDIRPNSPIRLHWQGFTLSEHNHKQVYVPTGFAHGFVALSDEVAFSYKHGSPYDPATEGAIRWNDPTLAIAWPLSGEPRISLKDQGAPLLLDANLPEVQ